MRAIYWVKPVTFTKEKSKFYVDLTWTNRKCVFFLEHVSRTWWKNCQGLSHLPTTTHACWFMWAWWCQHDKYANHFKKPWCSRQETKGLLGPRCCFKFFLQLNLWLRKGKMLRSWLYTVDGGRIIIDNTKIGEHWLSMKCIFIGTRKNIISLVNYWSNSEDFKVKIMKKIVSKYSQGLYKLYYIWHRKKNIREFPKMFKW